MGLAFCVSNYSHHFFFAKGISLKNQICCTGSYMYIYIFAHCSQLWPVCHLKETGTAQSVSVRLCHLLCLKNYTPEIKCAVHQTPKHQRLQKVIVDFKIFAGLKKKRKGNKEKCIKNSMLLVLSVIIL